MPRFQFSLRTLFIVVALLAIPCGYVGWQAKIVRDRKAMWARVRELGGEIWISTGLQPGSADPPQPSLVRRWFDDTLVPHIYIPKDTKPSDVQEMREAFPEATITPRP